jgi:hypothetical protein
MGVWVAARRASVASVALIAVASGCVASGDKVPDADNASHAPRLYYADGLGVYVDSAHHVLCYAFAQYHEQPLSCVALDSAHWYQRAERQP